jgi:Uma2 family endonuclease
VFFGAFRKTHNVFPCAELRLKLGQGFYLIPDVCVFHPIEPKVAVPDSPPLVAIEILSSDDRHTKVREKLEEYRTWGVPHVWLVDPYTKRMYTCDAGLNEVPTLRIPELGIEVTPADIFE